MISDLHSPIEFDSINCVCNGPKNPITMKTIKLHIVLPEIRHLISRKNQLIRFNAYLSSNRNIKRKSIYSIYVYIAFQHRNNIKLPTQVNEYLRLNTQEKSLHLIWYLVLQDYVQKRYFVFPIWPVFTQTYTISFVRLLIHHFKFDK